MKLHVHYCRPEAQAPFYNYEWYGIGAHNLLGNNIGPYQTLDDAIEDAKRRLKGCPSMELVRVKKDFFISGGWSTETVAFVVKEV